MPPPLPPPPGEALRRRVLAVHGEAARAWLDDLPAVAERWRRRWRLGPLAPLTASCAWVAAAERADGARCVLKLAPPGVSEPRREAHWLARVDGGGAAALLEADADAGALLLERLEPGTPLAALVPERDDEACDALAQVAIAVRRPAAPADADPRTGVPTLAERLADLAEHLAARPDEPLGPGVAAAAHARAQDLLAGAGAPALLHGDLHHDNALDAGARGWLAIDPHGLVGDPAYELATCLYNPFAIGPRAAELAPRRAARLAAAAGLDADRVRSWGFVQAVLSAVWSLDESPEPDRHVLAVAARLRD